MPALAVQTFPSNSSNRNKKMKFIFKSALFCLVIAISCRVLTAECTGGDSSNLDNAFTRSNETIGNQEEEDGSKVDAASTGGKSPEDAFAKFKKATEKNDYKGAFNCLDASTQNALAAGLVMMSGFMVMGDDEAAKKIEEVMKKHKLNDLDETEMEKFKDDQKAATEFIAAKVKNKSQFFEDVMKVAASAKNAGGTSFAIKGELKDIKIDGDEATGKIVMEGDREEPIKFVKVGGRWLIKMEM